MAPAGSPDSELNRRLADIQGRVDALARIDPAARAAAEELVSELLDLHGDALSRMLAIVDASSGGGALLEEFSADGVLASVLLIHDLHPLTTEQRVERALEGVRPYLAMHGGDVELIGVTGTTVQLRLKGSCDGCPSSAATLHGAVEKAVMDAAPEVVDLDVIGLVLPDALPSPVGSNGFRPLQVAGQEAPALVCPAPLLA